MKKQNVLKAGFITLALSMVFSSAFAKDSCKIYSDEIAMLKTVKGYEVEHGRFELIQLLQNNLSKKGYSFVSSEKEASFKLDVYAVNESKNGKCAEAQVLVTNAVTGKSVATEGSNCSLLSIIPNVNEIGAAKNALRSIPDCGKF